MAILAIYNQHGSIQADPLRDFNGIAQYLSTYKIVLEHWKCEHPLSANATQDEILSAYKNSVDRLNDAYGFQSVDVVSLQSDHPQREELRSKFRAEHTHADFEIRFFVEGCGLFYLNLGSEVALVLCEKGDLISVPAGAPHWFDMGAAPNFTCIRLFTTAEGWKGDFTQNDIVERFPDMDALQKIL